LAPYHTIRCHIEDNEFRDTLYTTSVLYSKGKRLCQEKSLLSASPQPDTRFNNRLGLSNS